MTVVQNHIAPIQIDDSVLIGLGRDGHRWVRGEAGLVSFGWLVPPEFVLAGQLPTPPPRGLIHLYGGGDRDGHLTAVLGYLRGVNASPVEMLVRRAGAVSSVTPFRSRTADAAERIERRDGKQVVTTIHAFEANGENYRFIVAAVGPLGDEQRLRGLRTIAAGLSLSAVPNPLPFGRINA